VSASFKTNGHKASKTKSRAIFIKNHSINHDKVNNPSRKYFNKRKNYLSLDCSSFREEADVAVFSQTNIAISSFAYRGLFSITRVSYE
jgi:hypothetical protein